MPESLIGKTYLSCDGQWVAICRRRLFRGADQSESNDRVGEAIGPGNHERIDAREIRDRK